MDAAEQILAGLTSWLAGQPDLAAAVASIRRFGELIDTTPALHACQHETTAGLVALAARLLADRAGRDASDAEPRIVATALLGLWDVYFTALTRYLDGRRTPAAVHAAVAADVARAARLLRDGLGAFTPAATRA
ncbi:MAG TPA: hypothetical protein VH089_28370 [Streptosporangiaceae bacterium]|nr:hypothetical protein [Streptosporangiaceae bacterium]